MRADNVLITFSSVNEMEVEIEFMEEGIKRRFHIQKNAIDPFDIICDYFEEAILSYNRSYNA